MGIGSWISGQVSAATEQGALLASRFNDKQTAEALVAIMTGCANADGELEDTERKKLAQAFDKHPILSRFDKSVLNRKFVQLNEGFVLDVDEGLAMCLKELDDVADAAQDKREAIMRMGKAAAAADGDVEPAERVFLTKCAKRLYLDPAEFGL